MQELTKELAVSVPVGTVFHYSHDSNGRIERWRKNGKTKTWVTRPDEWRMPVKHGLYNYGYITEIDAGPFHLESECEQ